jgi:hypothetical protein
MLLPSAEEALNKLGGELNFWGERKSLLRGKWGLWMFRGDGIWIKVDANCRKRMNAEVWRRGNPRKEDERIQRKF